MKKLEFVHQYLPPIAPGSRTCYLSTKQRWRQVRCCQRMWLFVASGGSAKWECRVERADNGVGVHTFNAGDCGPRCTAMTKQREYMGNKRSGPTGPGPRLAAAPDCLPSETRVERVTRLELATSSLARRCSTTELHPHLSAGIMSTALCPRKA